MHGESHGDDIDLNVVPMLDMFTILTIFLLMSYSTDPISLDVTKDLHPPKSNIESTLATQPNIVVTKKEILLNDVLVVPLNSKFNVVNPKKNIRQNAIMPLYQALVQWRKNMKSFLKRNPDNSKLKKRKNVLVLNADKRIPFKLLKQIMLTASQVEYITFDLVVTRDQ